MSGVVTLRPGRPHEAGLLSDLAFRSKAHWGYDAEFMEACRAELTVGSDDFARRRVVVAEVGGDPAGFAILDTAGGRAEVVDLWVKPAHIGAGVGRLLWEDAARAAAAAGFRALRVEADPHAVGFYRSVGAVEVGEAPSGSIPGRMLPLLEAPLP